MRALVEGTHQAQVLQLCESRQLAKPCSIIVHTFTTSCRQYNCDRPPTQHQRPFLHCSATRTCVSCILCTFLSEMQCTELWQPLYYCCDGLIPIARSVAIPVQSVGQAKCSQVAA